MTTAQTVPIPEYATKWERLTAQMRVGQKSSAE
jgi:hypothetical protein